MRVKFVVWTYRSRLVFAEEVLRPEVDTSSRRLAELNRHSLFKVDLLSNKRLSQSFVNGLYMMQKQKGVPTMGFK